MHVDGASDRRDREDDERPVADPRPEELALKCAKAFALEDTVVFGRVLLLQANGRSEVLAADARLNAPPPPLPQGVQRA